MGNGDLPKKLNGRVCVWVMAWNAVKCQHQKTCRVKGKSYRFGLGSTLISVLYLLQISPLFCSPSIHSRKFVRFWVRISKKGRKFTSKSWRSKRNEAKKKKTESLCFAALLGSHRVCYSLLPEFRPSPAGLHWESGRHLIEKKQPPSRHTRTHTSFMCHVCGVSYAYTRYLERRTYAYTQQCPSLPIFSRIHAKRFPFFIEQSDPSTFPSCGPWSGDSLSVRIYLRLLLASFFSLWKWALVCMFVCMYGGLRAVNKDKS